jgi:hypothetical protein
MTRITVIAVSPLDKSSWKYDVEIFENDGSDSKTSHQVTLDRDYYMDMTEGGLIVPEEFVKKSFQFLLDREPKDTILLQFDIAQINDFFPEYEKEIKKVVDRS